MKLILPYGGTLLNVNGIKNELVDHEQYHRVMKQPSAEDHLYGDKASWSASVENLFGNVIERKGRILNLNELEEVKATYTGEAAKLPQYKEEDQLVEELNEYERFTLDRNLKLRDLNRINDRNVELIKDRWTRLRSSCLQLIDLNPFTPYKYHLELARSALFPKKSPKKPRRHTISATRNKHTYKRSLRTKQDLRQIQLT